MKTNSSSKASNPERKTWQPDQDRILAEIVTAVKSRQWGQIAKIMEQQYSIIGRTGKQCRERWHNQLDPQIKNETWSQQEQELLFSNHNKFGNRWAKIAQALPGRTDNSIKNHFYCTLRKALRSMNRYINRHKNKSKLKEIKSSVLTKIVVMAEQKFDSKSGASQELIEECCQIKNKLIRHSRSQEAPQNLPDERLDDLISQINKFSLSYKSKSARGTVRDITATRSSSEESASVSDSEENDKMDQGNQKIALPEVKPILQQKDKRVAVQFEVVSQSVTTMIGLTSIQTYLLSPSIEMQMKDRPKVQERGSSGPEILEMQSFCLCDTEGHYSGLMFQRLNSNPVCGELNNISSFDYQNYQRKHR